MKKFILIILSVAAVATTLWLGRPAYKHWKEDRFLRQALEYFSKGDFHNAAFSARKTLDINPASGDGCRLMARIAEKMNSPQAVAWRMRVADLEPNAATNHQELARTAILFGNLPQAGRALGRIAESNRNTVDFHMLSVMLALAKNDLVSAEESCARAVRLDPQNKFARFNLAVLHLHSTNSATRDSAIKTLEELTSDNEHRRDALRNLVAAAVEKKDFDAAQNYSRRLLSDTNLFFEDRLAHLTVLKESANAGLSDYLASLEALAAGNTTNSLALGTWLRRHRMSDEALSWLMRQSETNRYDRATTEFIAECYADQGQWSKLETLLADKQWGDADFVRFALLARARRELKETFSSQADWRSAVNAASSRGRSLYALLQLADEWRWQTEAEEVAWKIIQQFPGENSLLAVLERNYLRAGNTLGLQKTYAAMMKASPTNRVVRNNFAAVSLLLNLQTTEAAKVARENYQAAPGDSVIASTYAYSLHIQGQTGDALRLLNALSDETLRSSGVAAYYGAILAAAGQTNRAMEFLDIAAQSHELLPEEKNLIAMARRSIAPAR